MKSLVIVAATLISLGFTTSERASVYICVSPKAKKYHFNKNCSGLRSCTHTIKSITKEKAKKLGYAVCSKETKRAH